MKTKASRLKTARLAKGLTIEQAAYRLCVAVSTYKGWEAGTTEPRSLDTAARVCDFFDISLDYYVSGYASEAQFIDDFQHLPEDVKAKTEELIAAMREAVTEP